MSFHFARFGLPMACPFSRYVEARDRQTDRQTDTAAHFIMHPSLWGRRHNKRLHFQSMLIPYHLLWVNRIYIFVNRKKTWFLHKVHTTCATLTPSVLSNYKNIAVKRLSHNIFILSRLQSTEYTLGLSRGLSTDAIVSLTDINHLTE